MCSVRPIVVFFFFFFSSRRRHTRSLSDRSSDVCSSDLTPKNTISTPRPASALKTLASSGWLNPYSSRKRIAEVSTIRSSILRSEEHTSELQSLRHLVCRLLLEKKKL